MHLLLELTTVFFFFVCCLHAVRVRGALGFRLMVMLAALGFVRESFVIVREILYGYADLNLKLGFAPLIAAVIWGYSIYLAICCAESITGERLEELKVRALSTGWWAIIGLFMVTLVGFYEPFLELVGMARWQDGTLKTAGVPWIALVGYPTLSVPFVYLWSRVEAQLRGAKRWGVELAFVMFLALCHASALQLLKDFLGW